MLPSVDGMNQSVRTAPLARPSLHLVPGSGRVRTARSAAPATADPSVSLPALAAEHAGRVNGTFYAPLAITLARELAARAPLLIRRGRAEVWAAAIAFLLAEESRLFELDGCATRTGVARELNSTLPTLRRRVAEVRAALSPFDIALPDPEED